MALRPSGERIKPVSNTLVYKIHFKISLKKKKLHVGAVMSVSSICFSSSAESKAWNWKGTK